MLTLDNCAEESEKAIRIASVVGWIGAPVVLAVGVTLYEAARWTWTGDAPVWLRVALTAFVLVLSFKFAYDALRSAVALVFQQKLLDLVLDEGTKLLRQGKSRG